MGRLRINALMSHPDLQNHERRIMPKLTIYKQPGQPGDPGEGWVVELPKTFDNQSNYFLTPSFADAIDFVRATLKENGNTGDVLKCLVCGTDIIWCIEPITGIEGWAKCGTHENSVDAFVCLDGEHAHQVTLPVPDAIKDDEPVYNDLTPPFVAQAYANIHAKIENFIINAIDAGVVEDDLRAIMLSDIDQLIANHSANLCD